LSADKPHLIGIADACDPWQPVRAELDLWLAAGQRASLWLRDDDAMAPSDALERLLDACRHHSVPLLLCVIPLRAEDDLAIRMADEPGVDIAVHGAWHRNHAPPGRKSEEMAAERGRETLLTDLTTARSRLMEMFGPRAGDWYVPPWNRISRQVAALLPHVGFKALSCFGDADQSGPGLRQFNTHVDLIDWRSSRSGRSEAWVAACLAGELAKARLSGFRPVGVLTHHLDHDDAAWASLAGLLNVASQHPAVCWVSATTLMKR
jgi:peptidoglycan/xylan/chitin deacetylase (PgdA/CDA1 family)